MAMPGHHVVESGIGYSMRMEEGGIEELHSPLFRSTWCGIAEWLILR